MSAVLHTPTAANALEGLLTRRSVSPRRLIGPGPSAAELRQLAQAALRAPDHGKLVPWRVIEFPPDQRTELADLFECERRERKGTCDELETARAREHAMSPPALIAFVVRTSAHDAVPEREQWLAAGAALGYILLACHLQGYGAKILSGERCQNTHLCKALGLSPDEQLAGFIAIGSAPIPSTRSVLDPPPETVWTRWVPPRSEPSQA